MKLLSDAPRYKHFIVTRTRSRCAQVTKKSNISLLNEFRYLIILYDVLIWLFKLQNGRLLVNYKHFHALEFEKLIRNTV